MLIDLADVDLAPFRTNQINTIVSFSGGRTSGVMLWHVLKAHDWNLPENVKVVFENTGKEREETLDFVHEVETRWGVDINWIEWRLEKPRFRRVNYETASRNGEPFAELIEWKGNYLPGPVQRMCTQHLKVDCMRHFIRSELQWDEWQSFIGIRADEPRRWRVEGPDPKFKRECREIPLRTAQITEEHVFEFWNKQPFDLQLKSYEGNCDLCFLKGHKKRMLIMEENPHLAQWWIDQEERTGRSFRPRQPFKDLYEYTTKQMRLPLLPEVNDDLGECLCHD